jgi:hypothetical protein
VPGRSAGNRDEASWDSHPETGRLEAARVVKRSRLSSSCPPGRRPPTALSLGLLALAVAGGCALFICQPITVVVAEKRHASVSMLPRPGPDRRGGPGRRGRDGQEGADLLDPVAGGPVVFRDGRRVRGRPGRPTDRSLPSSLPGLSQLTEVRDDAERHGDCASLVHSVRIHLLALRGSADGSKRRTA